MTLLKWQNDPRLRDNIKNIKKFLGTINNLNPLHVFPYFILQLCRNLDDGFSLIYFHQLTLPFLMIDWGSKSYAALGGVEANAGADGDGEARTQITNIPVGAIIDL
jgi:hypothetical protein